MTITIAQLLKLYPNGFVITANGTVEAVVAASSRFSAIGMNYPLPPHGGGYLVVEPTGKRIDDEGNLTDIAHDV